MNFDFSNMLGGFNTGKLANGKGACAYSTNMLTVGKHKVTVTPADIKYSGSKSATLKIKASAKKYKAWWEKVSKGKVTSVGKSSKKA